MRAWTLPDVLYYVHTVLYHILELQQLATVLVMWLRFWRSTKRPRRNRIWRTFALDHDVDETKQQSRA